MDTIKRREAIRKTAWIMGGVLSAPTIAGIMNGCSPKPELTWQPSFFDEEQARLIMEMSETILPKTDTPGAKDLGVPGFIEEMVSLVMEKQDRDVFMAGMKAFQEEVKSTAGKTFSELSPEKQYQLLKAENDRITDKQFVFTRLETPFFYTVKYLTLVGYYTTEHGATNELQYAPIPVEYNGCLPLEETGQGKTWATR